MKNQKARNIEVKYELSTFSGEKNRGQVSQYMMAPESDEIWDEYRAFNRGDKETVQLTANLGYWHFLKTHQDMPTLDAALLPDIPFKFDRKSKDAIISLQDGCTLKVWIDIDLSK